MSETLKANQQILAKYDFIFLQHWPAVTHLDAQWIKEHSKTKIQNKTYFLNIT